MSDANEVDQLRVQLAGCSVAANGGTRNPAKQGDYGWSPAYQDVLDLRIRSDRWNETLKLIASCEPRHPDDVVSIARKALAGEPITNPLLEGLLHDVEYAFVSGENGRDAEVATVLASMRTRLRKALNLPEDSAVG